MSNQKLLRHSVELLKEIRSELSDTVEDSVLVELDQIIVNLEMAQKDDTQEFNATDVLFLLGSILDYLPLVIQVTEKLRQLVQSSSNH